LDIKQTRKIIENKSIDVVIVDKFKIKRKFLKELNKMVKVVYISDLNKIEYPANLVINGFIGYNNKISYNKYNSKCLLGSKYQILNEGFSNKKSKKKKYDLLVTFGGFDEKNIVELFLECWKELQKKLTVLIVLGPGTQKSEQLNRMLKKYPEKITVLNQTSKMFQEISRTRFGLCAGGITTYEFARMRLPFAIICQVRHQVLTAKEWEKKKIARNLGIINKNTRKNLNDYLSDIINNKIKLKIEKTSTNDSGSKIVVSEIMKMMNFK